MEKIRRQKKRDEINVKEIVGYSSSKHLINQKGKSSIKICRFLFLRSSICRWKKTTNGASLLSWFSELYISQAKWLVKLLFLYTLPWFKPEMVNYFLGSNHFHGVFVKWGSRWLENIYKLCLCVVVFVVMPWSHSSVQQREKKATYNKGPPNEFFGELFDEGEKKADSP